ncbi:GtrA family protein [Natronorarus salvus]|uniref:GtrA family protein n=1 Tax=Natronorarus salvus TaxID=3117733 RepID=UPI002F266B25
MSEDLGRTLLVRYARVLVSRVRLVKFALVGALGALVDTLVLGIGYTLVGLPIWGAKFVGAETAILVMFVVNERWTFADAGLSGFGALSRRLVRSNLVRVGGIAVATVVLVVLYRQVGVPWPLANLVGIGCGFLFNYTLESVYTWRVQWV